VAPRPHPRRPPHRLRGDDMQNEILVNAVAGETRVAILEKGTFCELHLERAGERGMVGDVVKGRVTRVLPGMQAAFVDIGLEKAAFLYAGDYRVDMDQVDLGEEGGDEPRPRRRRGNGRSAPPKIESMLSEGQEVVVQVAKEPIGTKGARITSHVSIAGRHLVLTPWSPRVGVSRRIGSDKERRRLRDLVERLRPRELGFIIRTAGDGVRERDLEADIRYLAETWSEIQTRREEVRAPAVLYQEPALPMRVVRDVVGHDTRRIVIDDPELHAAMERFCARFMVDPPRIERYADNEPIFDRFDIERQIDANLGRKVWLKSGGYLIIDQSEALTAIDVNTGRFVGKRDLEETVLRTNLEAVREVVHQLRFRNIGGLIIIDLIDMDDPSNREKVYRALQDALRQDKARTNILKISELGLVEMTRKRTRESLVQMLCEPCAHCDGKGYVLSEETVTYKLLREIRKDLPRFRGKRVTLAVSRRVAEHLLGGAKESLAAVERDLGREIEIRVKPDLHHEQFEVAGDEGPVEPVEFVPGWLATPGRGNGSGDEAGAASGAKGAPDGAQPAGTARAGPGEPPAEAAEPAAEEAAEPPAEEAAETTGEEPAAPPSAAAPEALDAEPENQILPGSGKPGES